MTNKKNKRMPVWAMITADVICTAAAIGVFMLFDYVMPQSSNNKGTVITDTNSSHSEFVLPDNSTFSSGGANTNGQNHSKPNVPNKNDGGHISNYGNTGTDTYASDQNDISSITNAKITTENIGSAKSDKYNITCTKKTVGSGNDTITYFSADIYVTNANVINAYFANNSYGKNIKDSVSNMAKENNATFAINGDFYGNSEQGVVIRNGVKYRDTKNDADICVLFTDGTMKTYSPNDFNSADVISGGAWQAWNFGPALLDGSGKVLSEFNTTTYLNSSNPRTAIGMVKAGHYKFVTVDGRNVGYSKGATMSELAAIMSDEGCKTAYNMDGGKSAMMYFNGQIVNKPDGNGRELSDIIYIKGE